MLARKLSPRKASVPILIVEDNDEDFVAMARVLSRAGIRNPLERCATGDAALRRLAVGEDGGGKDAQLPGLVFLDLNLPGTSGREVLEAIKSDPALRTIPVLVLTSSPDPQDVQRSYSTGANSYMLKPSGPDDLTELMAAVRDYWLGTGLLLAGVEPD
jgi:CheY-like chemotaxis protein